MHFFSCDQPLKWKPLIHNTPTLYHCILGVGLPVMMAVNVAAWPGSTYRSSVGTWIEGGAEPAIGSVSILTKFHRSHALMFGEKREYHL